MRVIHWVNGKDTVLLNFSLQHWTHCLGILQKQEILVRRWEEKAEGEQVKDMGHFLGDPRELVVKWKGQSQLHFMGWWLELWILLVQRALSQGSLQQPDCSPHFWFLIQTSSLLFFYWTLTFLRTTNMAALMLFCTVHTLLSELIGWLQVSFPICFFFKAQLLLTCQHSIK